MNYWIVDGGLWRTQRKLNVPWQDYVWLTEVMLVPLDSQTSPVDLTADVPMRVAQGRVVTDEDGTRQATVLFPQNVQGELLMPDGSIRPITSLHVRATEYTVGPDGPKAMPAELPANTGYTYCVELSVDEAVQAGAQDGP